MKKYGLQIRVKPQEKKRPNPLVPNPIFGDEDDDNVEMEIMRQAYKNKSHKDVEEQQQKALEEDPSVFDYDGVYDKMKEKQIRPVQQEREERKPKYIQALIDKAKQRERDSDVIYERKLAKERAKDEHLYADKDRFVTGAYKRKLAEQEKWRELERLRELREQKDDVTKKTDLSDFYFNLSKNVAFGAGEAEKKAKELVAKPEPEISASTTAASPETHEEAPIKQVLEPENRSEDSQLRATGSGLDDKGPEEPSASHQPESKDLPQGKETPTTAPKGLHKKSEDALAAARERFLARKKAKIQE